MSDLLIWTITELLGTMLCMMCADLFKIGAKLFSRTFQVLETLQKNFKTFQDFPGGIGNLHVIKHVFVEPGFKFYTA